MTFKESIQLQLQSFAQIPGLLKDPKVRLFLLPSFLIWVVFILLSSILFLSYSFLKITDFIPYLGEALGAVLSPFFTAGNMLLQGLFSFAIINLLSPVNCMLSDYVYKRETGLEWKFNLLRFIRLLGRSITVFILCYLTFTFCKFILSLISFALPYEVINNLLLYILTCVYVAFVFYDYNFERYNMKYRTCLRFVKANLFPIFLTGLTFNLLFLIPYLGMLIAPFLITLSSTYVFSKLIKTF